MLFFLLTNNFSLIPTNIFQKYDVRQLKFEAILWSHNGQRTAAPLNGSSAVCFMTEVFFPCFFKLETENRPTYLREIFLDFVLIF